MLNMWNHNISLSPADLAKPLIIHVNSRPFRGSEPRGSRKVEYYVKMVCFRGSPAFLVNFTKTTPGTVFWVEIHPETHFCCPGPLKRHRKSIGFAGVCAPGPPKHHFHPTELKIRGNHLIFMKCCGIPPTFTKMVHFWRNAAKGRNTLKDCLLNIILFQPSEKSTRARDSAVSVFSHAKWEFHAENMNSTIFTVISPDFHFPAPQAREKHQFGQAIPCSNQCLAAGGPKGAQSTSKH